MLVGDIDNDHDDNNDNDDGVDVDVGDVDNDHDDNDDNDDDGVDVDVDRRALKPGCTLQQEGQARRTRRGNQLEKKNNKIKQKELASLKATLV